MSKMTSMMIVAILVVITGVAVGLLSTRPSRSVMTQEASLPGAFQVGATVTLDFGSPPWRIEEIQGSWLRVVDASSEPQYSGTFWLDVHSGKFWAVR